MEIKLEGPMVLNLVGGLTVFLEKMGGLADAATLACLAFTDAKGREMKLLEKGQLQADQELAKRRADLKNEVRQLEERIRKARTQVPQQPVVAKPAEKMKGGTQPLTQEEQAAHRAKVEAERESKKEAEMSAGPLKFSPFAKLATMEANEAQQT